MLIRNTTRRFGCVHIVLHWLVALVIFGMFGLGYYMVDLTYYHAWYNSAPAWHKSIGVLLLLTMLFRLVWRLVNPVPAVLASHHRWEVLAAHAAHLLLYILVFVAMISGYLITTADGSAIQVFDWFRVPSVTGQVKRMEDTAGLVHYWSTWALVVLATVHGLAAIKHHVIDKDETLRRMLGLHRHEQ